MQDFKAFVCWMAGAIGITATIAILIALSAYMTIIGWVVLAGIAAVALGLSVKYILLPILSGSIAIADRVADIGIKISDHMTAKKIAMRTVPVDDNGNAILYGVQPYEIMQIQGQFKQPVPSSIHQHWDYKGLPAGKEVLALPEPAQQEAISSVIRYDDIADQVPSELSLLGIYPENGHLEIVSPDNYKTAWFVGGSNMGKTNTVYGKVADAVRWGAKLIICDPHAAKPDSLTNKLSDFHHALLLPVARTDAEIYKAIMTFLEEFKARRDVDKSCHQKILIVIDEVNGLAKHPLKINDKDVKMQMFLQELAETCGYEARGFNMYGYFISQKVAGLSWLRNAMMTVFVHGLLMESEAKLAANNDRKLTEQVMGFKKGRTLVYGYEIEPTILQQPLYGSPKEEHPSTYPGHESLTVQTAQASDDPYSVSYSAPYSAGYSASSSTEHGGVQGNKPMEYAFEGDMLKLKKVLQGLADRKTQVEIVCEVWEVEKNTRAYNKGVEEYREMLAWLAKESEA